MQPLAPTTRPCSCGVAGVHAVAARATLDGYPVVLYSDGRLETTNRAGVTRTIRIPLEVGRVVLDWVAAYRADHLVTLALLDDRRARRRA